MSWRASAYVIDVLARKHEWLSLSHIAVLLAIAARHHQDDHCAWGQLQRLSEDTHASVGTLSRLIGDLEAGEVLAVWEGYLPKRKGEPEDARRRRSLLFTFPGLDADDGPPYDNVQRHVRRGGAGMHAANGSVDESASDFSDHQPESVAPEASEAEAVEGDQLQPIASPELHHEQLLNVLLPAGIPDTTRSVVIPVSPAGTRARAPDEAAPRRAAGDDSPDDSPDSPRPLRSNAQVCPLCRQAFMGPYDEHTAAAHKVRARAEPGNLGGALPRAPTAHELEAELARLGQEKVERLSQMPPELRAELEREHEARLAREREKAALVPQEASP